MTAATVAVYNPGGDTPLHFVSLTHAARMLVRQVAIIRDHVPGEQFGPYDKPRSLTLIKYVFESWRYASRPRRGMPAYSRERLMARDKYQCQYEHCSNPATTVDHVIPRCKGGNSTWENCVACCETCNRAKGSKTCQEAGLVLRVTPWAPTWAQLSEALREARVSR